MDYEIRKIKESELDSALILTWNTFLKYNASFSSPEGVEFFKNHIAYSKMLKRLNNDKCIFIGTFDSAKLIGFVMGTSEYIDLFFIRYAEIVISFWKEFVNIATKSLSFL